MAVRRTRNGGEWTEAEFFGFIRSNLRLMSRKWNPRKLAEHRARAPYTGPNKRQKWKYQCARCWGWFKRTEVEVDHVEPCGTLKSFDDAGEFLRRLLVEVDGFEVLCEECHQAKTNRQRAASAECG